MSTPKTNGIACLIWLLSLIQFGCARQSPSAVARPEPPPRQLNLLAMGDWGEGVPAQKRVADAMAEYVAGRHEHFAALISAGDNFYVPLSGIDDPVWQNLFEKMYDPVRLNFPFYIALGNHDYDRNKYLVEFAYAPAHPESRWKQPGRWFRVDLPEKNPRVTLIILDSNHDNLTAAEWNEQIGFLQDELAKPRAPWTICCAHHPLFSNGIAADNGILQHDWGTLFKKYGVDIYLCGHEHNLQHLEIPGWKTSFILAGGGGAHSHPLIRDNRGPFSRSVYGFVHFDFAADHVTVHYIGTDGKPVHEFERSKAGEVKVLMTTPSDAGVAKPLEVLQGIYDKLHPAQTQPMTAPATRTGK
jgi:hypothetical protein